MRLNMQRFIGLLALVLCSFAYGNGQELREDTATQIALGPFVDGTDGVTAQTALTVADWDCDLIKHADTGMTNTALTITASAGSNDAAHIQSGMYSLELTATDTSTAGRLTIICDHATPTTFVPVRQTYMVMPTQEYDSLYGTDVLQVHAVEIANDLITAAAIATDAIGAAEIATDAIGAAEIATDAIGAAEIAADAVGAAEAGFLTDSTGFQGADIAATLADTADMQPKLGTFSDLGSGATLAGNLEDMRDDGTATYSRTTDSLQAIRDQGDAAWITGGGGACTADVGCIADGTAAAVTATTLDMASGETFADDELIGATVVIASATAGTGQSRIILDNAATNDRLTVDTWTTTPTGTVTYRVFATPTSSDSAPVAADVRQWLGTAAATPTTAGVPEVDVVAVAGTAQTPLDIGQAASDVLDDTADMQPKLGTPAVTLADDIAAVPTAAENATEHLSQQRVLTGTCDSGSTTTCVDDALTQANESQLDDRLICFSDSWCALITGFTPASDTVTTTKTAPSTRASLGYTIFPATAQ